MKPALLFTHYLLPLLFVAVGLSAYSQDGPYLKNALNGGTGGRISPSLTLDANGANIISWSNNIGRALGTYSLWLETGDGNYVNSFPGTNISISPGGFHSSPILIATKLYEHQPRPPQAISNGSTISNVGPPTAPVVMSSPVLAKEPPGTVIKLFSNVREIVPADEMAFGISYVPKSKIKFYKVVFRYNHSGQNTFEVANTGKVSKFKDYSGGSGSTDVDINAIRYFANERVSLAEVSDRKYLNGYSNAIIFDGNPGASDTCNIFISMLPLGNLTLGTLSDVEAMIYESEDGEKWTQAGVSSISGMQSASAHDPNNISVSPQCLSLPQTAQVLHYSINFQNTGLGDADEIVVVCNIPREVNKSRGIRIVKAFCGGVSVAPAITEDWVNGRIIFKIVHDLAGCKFPYGLTSIETMGQIDFDVEISPGNNPADPAVLQAWAEIYFNSKGNNYEALKTAQENLPCYIVNDSAIKAGFFLPGTYGYEMPVRTNNAIALFSKCCGIKNNDCQCKDPRGFRQYIQCYWYILVIIVLLLLLILFWYRKRYHHR